MQDIWRDTVWMTEAEQTHARKFNGAMRRLFKARGVPETPLLVLRVMDVAIHCLLVRRQEMALMPGEEDGLPVLSGALADQIGKSRERLRKAIRELEDACARLGKPVDVGLAEEMIPVLNKAGDLLQRDATSSDATPE